MKPEYIDNRTKKQLKEILLYLKLARSSDYMTYNALISGEKFKKTVLAPLENITGWDEKDEKQVKELSEKLESETKGKTIKERSDKLDRILKIGGGIAAGAGIIGGIAYLLKNNHKTEKR